MLRTINDDWTIFRNKGIFKTIRHNWSHYGLREPGAASNQADERMHVENALFFGNECSGIKVILLHHTTMKNFGNDLG